MSDNEICTELYLTVLRPPGAETETETEKHQSSNHFFIRNKIRKLMEFLGSPLRRVVLVLILVFASIFIFIFIVNFRQTESLAEHLKHNNFFSFPAFCIFLL